MSFHCSLNTNVDFLVNWVFDCPFVFLKVSFSIPFIIKSSDFVIIIESDNGLCEEFFVVIDCHIENTIILFLVSKCFQCFWCPIFGIFIRPFSSILFTSPWVSDFNKLDFIVFSNSKSGVSVATNQTLLTLSN